MDQNFIKIVNQNIFTISISNIKTPESFLANVVYTTVCVCVYIYISDINIDTNYIDIKKNNLIKMQQNKQLLKQELKTKLLKKSLK